MEKIPQELVNHISSYLDRKDLRNTLFVSNRFRYAAEKYSYAFQSYNLTESNVREFVEIYSSRRFSYLRSLNFSTNLPEHEAIEYRENCRETAEQLESLDHEFTRQINLLFSAIKTVENCNDNYQSRAKISLTLVAPSMKIENRHACLHHFFVSWRVHLLTLSTLPSLSSVRHFLVQAPDHQYQRDRPNPALRKLDHRVMLDLAKKLPNLDTLECMVGGDEWDGNTDNEGLRRTTRDYEGPQRDSRQGFADAFHEGSLPALRHVHLDFLHPSFQVTNLDQRRILPNLITPFTFDPFSTSLRMLSYQLRSMRLCVVADETLFWPTEGSNDIPIWPYLEEVKITFHISTPSGSWYFKGPPGVGGTEFTTGDYPPLEMYPPFETSEYDRNADYDVEVGPIWNGMDDEASIFQFRIVPNEDLLVPFVTAFARAASHMPCLKNACLWTHLPHDYDLMSRESPNFEMSCKVPHEQDLAWGILYSRPGEENFLSQGLSVSRQLWWSVGSWRPDSETHDIFRQIGRKQHGDDLVEYWGKPGDDQALAYYIDF